MARKQSLIVRFCLLALLSPSCAWAAVNNDGLMTHEEVSAGQVTPRDEERAGRREEQLWKRVEAEVIQIVEELVVARLESTPRQQHVYRRDAPHPAARAPQAPQITPPPSLLLYKRQGDGQIAQLSAQIQSISQASRAVSQASQQVSQSSQQLSNSLQQVQQQLSQTAQSLASARASADASRQSAEQANQDAQQASRDADQARQSASQAISAAQSSASVAADAAGSSAASSAARSAASVIAAASQSAQAAMSSAASVVQAAKADATALRTEADNRVLQAQGAAVSVTQAALAIVGAIIGSSLLTIAAFVLVLRYKRRRRDRRSMFASKAIGGSNIGYPSSSGSNDYQNAGYGSDIKQPEPAMTTQTTKVGFPTSDYSTASNRDAAVGGNRASFHLRTPPKGKFNLFPKNGEEKQQRDEEMGSPTSSYSQQSEKDKAESAAARRSNMYSPPSLDKWLRAGTNVSPFGTLNGSLGAQQKKGVGMGHNWPLNRKGSS